MGAQFVEWACSVSDDWHLIGVELYKPGIGAMLSKADKLGLSNFSFIDQPIQAFLGDIASEGIDEVNFFDPWPKKKHGKKAADQYRACRRVIEEDGCRSLPYDCYRLAAVRLGNYFNHRCLQCLYFERRCSCSSSPGDGRWLLDKQNLRREASGLVIVFGISHTQKKKRFRVRRRSEGSSQDTL